MCIADPPDNIGLAYDEYDDNLSPSKYRDLLWHCVNAIQYADIVFISFNARHFPTMGSIVEKFPSDGISFRWLIQNVTFGYYAQKDFGYCFRPILRVMRNGAETYPDAVRVQSARQKLGDKRANPKGKIPGDCWEIPRVTGNSKQRRKWHKTQLHEDLYRRCLLYSCQPGDSVCDLFSGTGTLARASRGMDLDVTMVDISEGYCARIAAEHELEVK
jgi:DNA modification methylase